MAVAAFAEDAHVVEPGSAVVSSADQVDGDLRAGIVLVFVLAAATTDAVRAVDRGGS
jgi:hypothetical protein